MIVIPDGPFYIPICGVLMVPAILYVSNWRGVVISSIYMHVLMHKSFKHHAKKEEANGVFRGLFLAL